MNFFIKNKIKVTGALLVIAAIVIGGMTFSIKGSTTYEEYFLDARELDKYKKAALEQGDQDAAERVYKYYLFIERDVKLAEEWENDVKNRPFARPGISLPPSKGAPRSGSRPK